MRTRNRITKRFRVRAALDIATSEIHAADLSREAAQVAIDLLIHIKKFSETGIPTAEYLRMQKILHSMILDTLVTSNINNYERNEISMIVYGCLDKVGSILIDSSRRKSPAFPTGLLNRFPKFWESFAFFLPHNTRKQAHEPAFNELLQDYHLVRKKYRGRIMRWWIVICFTVRSLLMVIECLRVFAAQRTVGFVVDSIRGFLGKG